MSLWTPGGEHPVDRATDAEPTGAPTPMAAEQRLSSEQEADAQGVAAEMQQVREQLAQVPAAVVVANHAMGCYELAAIHLSNQPPRFDEAQLAIDAFAALLGAIEGRLGGDEATLVDALAQIRLAYVQIKAQWDAQDGPEGQQPADEGQATSEG